MLDRFLRTLNISDVEAVFFFNFAPLSTRRDIAMLGVVHRSALGLGPPALHRFFRPLISSSSSLSRPRLRSRRHARHRVEPGFTSPDYLLHSVIGSQRVYNLLPDYVIEANSVCSFQSRATRLLCSRARRGLAWREFFSPRAQLASHPLRSCRGWAG